MKGDLIYLAPDAGVTLLNPLGGAMVQKVTDHMTHGSFSLHDNILPAQSTGPRPHLHRQHDETFYVLSGELTVQAGARRVKAQPGACVVVPRGVVHQPSNAREQPVHILLLFSPAGMDDFFIQTAAGKFPLQHLPADAEAEARLAAFLAPYGYEFADLPPVL